MDKIRPKKFHPLPPHAKKVFHGVRWQVFQWEQEIFDGTKAIYESLKRMNGAFVIPVLENEKVVIIEEIQPHWKDKAFSIIGGGIEEGEDPLTGVKRELEEETGMVFKDFYLVGLIQTHPTIEDIMYMFVAKNFVEQKVKRFDGGENITTHEFTFKELIEKVRQRGFHYNPNFIEEFIIRDEIEKFYDLLRNPQNYAIDFSNKPTQTRQAD